VPHIAQRIESSVPLNTIVSARSSEGVAQGIRKSTGEASSQAPVGNLWRYAAQTATTWEDFEFKFDERFIFSAYQTLLGRDPDPDGLSNYVLQLRRGKSKIPILSELLQSAEYSARDGHLKQLRRALSVRDNAQIDDNNHMAILREPAPNSAIAVTVREALAYSADAFVTHVWHYSLGISPDPQVITEYVGRMNAGLPKAQVLADFLNSEPAKHRAALLHRIGS
jgi:hypothetical protein